MRLDHLYCLALKAFRQSQGPEIVSKDASGGQRVVKTRVSQGNTRYLQMAMRIAAQQSRIPVTPIIDDGCDEATVELRDEQPIFDAEAEVASPPEEACSPATEQPAVSAEASYEDRNATATPEATSSKASAAGSEASFDFAAGFFPVQTDVRVDPVSPFEEPILTRKQRKRQARMLAELRKAK